VPLLPASLIEPLWAEFAALIGAEECPEFSPSHPWGCHRRRVPDRVVFDRVIAALVHGSGYERLASPGCSDRTIRRRLAAWAQAGHGRALLCPGVGRLRPDDRTEPGRPGRGRRHHQGALRGRGRPRPRYGRCGAGTGAGTAVRTQQCPCGARGVPRLTGANRA